MTVYVDSVRDYTNMLLIRNESLRHTKFCHMLSDSPDELIAMASTIGLDHHWLQLASRASRTHFDITPSKRKLAIEAGAVEITTREWLKMQRAREATCINCAQPIIYLDRHVMYMHDTQIGYFRLCSTEITDDEPMLFAEVAQRREAQPEQ